MSATVEARPDVAGFRLPRIHFVPTLGRRIGELGREALYLAGEAGLVLDEWEAFVLQHSLRLRADRTWGALEVGLCVPRQNGKGSVLEARELVAAFIDAERWPEAASRLTVHSAHEAKTAHEGFDRLNELIQNTPRLRSKLKPRGRGVRESIGGEAITLKDGRRIRFRTRTSGGGRGLSGDLLVFDEAMILSETMHRAVWPIVTARPNPQIWYTGSAVDQLEPLMAEHGVVFSRVRARGIAQDEDLAYFEWSVDAERPDEVTPEMAADPEVWAQANPGLDIRLSRRVISVEQRSLSPRGFAVERLGVGDWPDPESAGRVIDPALWADACDPESRAEDPVCLAFDVTPDRARACVAAAGYREDGRIHVEVIEHARWTSWVGGVLERLVEANRPLGIVVDARGAAGSLLAKLEEDHGLRVAEKGRPRGRIVTVTGAEHAKGCGQLFDAIQQDRLRHLGTPELNAAVAGAVKRETQGAWLWDRKQAADISPLVAVTLAVFGLYEFRHRQPAIVSLSELDSEEPEGFDEAELPPLDPEDL